MSEFSEKEFASAMKWIAVILCAAFVYSYFSTPFYFTRSGTTFYKGNTHTGNLERLEDDEWVDVTKTESQRKFRQERRKRIAERDKRIEKSLAEVEEEDDTSSDLYGPEDEEREVNARRY